MKRMILALALVACAVPLCVHAGPRCHKLGQRFAAKRATATPVRVMPTIGKAVVAPVAFVVRAAKATCTGPGCGK